jgi:hypothetical protein
VTAVDTVPGLSLAVQVRDVAAWVEIVDSRDYCLAVRDDVLALAETEKIRAKGDRGVLRHLEAAALLLARGHEGHITVQRARRYAGEYLAAAVEALEAQP